MKKTYYFSKRIYLLFTIFLLAGCQKVFDYIHLPGNGGAVSTICQVTKINSARSNYSFNYNQRGDPASIITDRVGTGNANVFFIYDKYQRVGQVLRSFGPTISTPGGYEAWSKFGYNAAGQIARDTSYAAGGILADGTIAPSELFATYSINTYNTNGQLLNKKDSSCFRGVFNFRESFTYHYDARGNLDYFSRNASYAQSPEIPAYVDTFRLGPYDDKIQVRRTNKLWMYLDRNYSINNPFTAAAYNSYGLPVTIDASQYFQGITAIAPDIYGNTIFTYNCKN
jgi:hypothetical protein